MHTVKGFGVVNKAEVDVFLELSCFSYDPTAVGNSISASSAFSKSSLNIYKFSVHMLLKPSLENFEDYFAGVWDECDLLWEWFEVNCCYKGPDRNELQSWMRAPYGRGSSVS